MPTNLQRAIAKKLDAQAETKFMHSVMLVCVAVCLMHLLIVMESPLFAAAIRLLRVA